MLTKSEFDKAMIKGWKHKKFLIGNLCKPSTINEDIKPIAVCAMGAVICGMNNGIINADWDERWKKVKIPYPIHEQIVNLSNSSKTKTEAIRKIKALEW